MVIYCPYVCGATFKFWFQRVKKSGMSPFSILRIFHHVENVFELTLSKGKIKKSEAVFKAKNLAAI